jgi:exopolysaccharide biosynthesis polyprenyl glycosylphosphotransferase
MRYFIRFIDQKGLSILILLISDIFWYFLSFILAFFIRASFLTKYAGLSALQSFSTYLTALPVVLLIMIIVFYFFGLYEKQNRITSLNEISSLTKATTFCLILIMASSFLQNYNYSRILVLLFWSLSLFFMNFGRFLLRRLQYSLYRKGYGVKRVLIIGANKFGKKLASKIEEYKDFGYKIIGFVDDYAKLKNNKYKFFGSTKELLEIIKKEKITYVYLADPAISHENMLNLINECDGEKVEFKIFSDLFEIVAGEISLEQIEEIPSINLNKPKQRFIYDISKRIMDFICSFFGLILLSPFFLAIIIAIKLDTDGKAIFIQDRIGKNGKNFKMYKFRTMHKNVDKHSYAPKNSHDKRITRVGKFLRQTSLDELPQLINVIKGEMSIVGPRPEMPFIVAKYKTWQKARLEVVPGITGLWQILGRKDLPLHENLEYDFYYIKNRSFLLDIIIFLKTIAVVVLRRGAY